MRYVEFSRHVRILWQQARHGYALDPQYREWIVERTIDRIFDATLHHDNAPDELGKHLAWDYRLEGQEHDRFNHWWQHVMEHGFNTPNPLSHLHKQGKVKA